MSAGASILALGLFIHQIGHPPMSCVLRISGPGVKASLSKISLEPYRVEDDAAHFDVSEADFSNFQETAGGRRPKPLGLHPVIPTPTPKRPKAEKLHRFHI